MYQNSKYFYLPHIFAIVIFFSLLTASYPAEACRSKSGMTSAQIKMLEGYVKLYKNDTGDYPKNGFNDLVAQGFLDETPFDAWDNPIQYRRINNSSNQFEIISFGANGLDDHGDYDDITNLSDRHLDYYLPHSPELIMLGLVFLCFLLSMFTIRRLARHQPAIYIHKAARILRGLFQFSLGFFLVLLTVILFSKLIPPAIIAPTLLVISLGFMIGLLIGFFLLLQTTVGLFRKSTTSKHLFFPVLFVSTANFLVLGFILLKTTLC